MTNAGIADAMEPVVAPAVEPVAPAAHQVAETAAMPSVSASTTTTVVWTGRRGDEDATPEDADRALSERQHLRPACDWTVKQNPEEWYVLEGQQRGRNVVLQATQ